VAANGSDQQPAVFSNVAEVFLKMLQHSPAAWPWWLRGADALRQHRGPQTPASTHRCAGLAAPAATTARASAAPATNKTELCCSQCPASRWASGEPHGWLDTTRHAQALADRWWALLAPRVCGVQSGTHLLALRKGGRPLGGALHRVWRHRVRERHLLLVCEGSGKVSDERH